MMERRTLSVSNHVDGEPLGQDEDNSEVGSTRTVPNNNGGPESRPSQTLPPADKTPPIEVHTQILHAFLVAHAENIRTLQDALSDGTTIPTAVAKPVVHGKPLFSASSDDGLKTDGSGPPPAPPYKSVTSETIESKPSAEDLKRQFTMLVVIVGTFRQKL